MDDRVRSGRRLPAGSFRMWAAKLSQPSVLLLVRDDHIIVQEDGELLASGFLLGGSSAPPRR